MRRVPNDTPAMRIVADTNTVVSGLLWQGPPRQLFDFARSRTLTLCTSPTLLAELAEVIGRGKFLKRVNAAGLSASALVRDYEYLAKSSNLMLFPRPPAAILTTMPCLRWPLPHRPT